MQNIFVVAAKRTPFGAFGGSLKHLSATELATHSTQAALQGIDPALIDAIFVGNVVQSSSDAAYLARHVGLKSGIPQKVPALTINRLCGSGFETLIQGALSMKAGESQVTLCAGTENMSSSPLQIGGIESRFGIQLGKGLNVRDALWDGLTDAYANIPMGITAENLATKYDISREECDTHAVRSQNLWGKAQANAVFDHEMAPIDIPIKKKKGEFKTMDTDEHPRPDTTFEQLSKLRPVFKKDGVVTAASASGICDGAGSIILATEQAVKDHGLTPLCRLASYHVEGCDPSIMGIGPVPAIRGALAKSGHDLHNDVDRIEINEAFAAQFLACAKELELDMDKTNAHGGAISLGHPLGASGSRIVAHLAQEFQRKEASHQNIHVGAACIGGGQGIAVVLERV